MITETVISAVTGEAFTRQVAPPVEPTPTMAEKRSSAVLTRAAFCKALWSAGVLPAAEVGTAISGGWPQTFASFLASQPEAVQVDAVIKWGDPQTVAIHYSDPLLQALALVATQGDQTAATALLDQIFGLS